MDNILIPHEAIIGCWLILIPSDNQQLNQQLLKRCHHQMIDIVINNFSLNSADSTAKIHIAPVGMMVHLPKWIEEGDPGEW